jgi:hypothetical protein
VPAADAATRSDEAPAVRDTETVELLIDGQAVLGAMQTARTGRPGVVVAAPIVETDVDLPPDATTRWPQHPPTTATAEAWNPANAGRIRTDWQARFIGTGNDVELVLPAGIAPREAHVRIFPRVFVEGAALDEGPTALRGDGAAGRRCPAGRRCRPAAGRRGRWRRRAVRRRPARGGRNRRRRLRGGGSRSSTECYPSPSPCPSLSSSPGPHRHRSPPTGSAGGLRLWSPLAPASICRPP